MATKLAGMAVAKETNEVTVTDLEFKVHIPIFGMLISLMANYRNMDFEL